MIHAEKFNHIRCVWTDLEDGWIMLDHPQLRSMGMAMQTIRSCPAFKESPTQEQILETHLQAVTLIGKVVADQIFDLWNTSPLVQGHETIVLVNKFAPEEWLDDRTMCIEMILGVAYLPAGYRPSRGSYGPCSDSFFLPHLKNFCGDLSQTSL